MGLSKDWRITSVVFTFLVIAKYAEPQSPSREARSSCMSYLGEKLSSRYSTAQVASACTRYAKWGNMMKSGPKVHMKQTEKNYMNHLHGTFSRQPGVRKEYRMLTDLERTRFHNAVNRLKVSMEGDMSRYDVLVGFHQPPLAPGAHFGPSFAGWHREYLFRMEQALQEIDSRVTLPYWDSTMDEILGEEARNTVMWSDSFAGNLEGDVVTGPFKNWDIFYPVQNRTKLFRKSVPEGGLYTDEVVNEVINAPSLRDITWFVDPTFEFVHGTVHDWVGGALGDLGVSPADPVFFILHSFVDCVFEWHRQDKIQMGVEVRYSFPNDSVAHGVGIANPLGDIIESTDDSLHLAVRPMEPFQGLLNIDGLSNSYNRFYRCAPRPSCSKSSPKCGSAYLFCETNRRKCAPKLVEGANCTKWSGMNPCYKSVCCGGVCSRTCSSNRRRTQNPNRYQETVYKNEAPNLTVRKPTGPQYNSKANNHHEQPSHRQQPNYQHQPVRHQYGQSFPIHHHAQFLPPPPPPPFQGFGGHQNSPPYSPWQFH